MVQEVMTNKDKEIGKRIRAIRIKHKLSQEEMADILGIHSTPHYQNIEYGKSRVRTLHLQIIYERFGASPNYILLGEVTNEQEYVYDFFSRPTDEKIKIFVEIAKQAFGDKQYDFDVFVKKKQDNLHKGEIL